MKIIFRTGASLPGTDSIGFFLLQRIFIGIDRSGDKMVSRDEFMEEMTQREDRQ